MDEKIFPNPTKFDPDRWLTNDNLDKYLLPFSVGKRFCIGKHLARDILFLTTIRLVQHFNFNVNDEAKSKNEQDLRIFGLSRALKPVEMKIDLV